MHASDPHDRVYAIGDIHGRLDLLADIEARIAGDLAADPAENPLICYLGDYVDRGPDSAGVIDHLIRSAGIDRIFLMGNHEDRMLRVMKNGPANGPGWAAYGARETLMSYGIDLPAAPEDWTALSADLRQAVPEAHRAFLRDLRPSWRWRQYFFAHAGVDPDRPLDAQSGRDLMWIRDPFLQSGRDFGAIVVHGHTIHPTPEFRPNRIGIDTGAYRSGILTAVALEEGRPPRLLQTGFSAAA